MGDQIIITDDDPKPDVIVVEKPIDEEAKREKTVVTETVKVVKTETH